MNPPLLPLLYAALFLFAYGAIWLSVRNQHSYTGPDFTTIAIVYIAVAVMIGVAGRVVHGATAGVSRRSARKRLAEGAIVAAAYVAAYVFMGALRYDGAGNAIVYGVFAATGPLIVVGSVMAAFAAAREVWPSVGLAMAIVAVCTGSAFAGPIWVWAFAGVGCSVACLVYAAARVWPSRASTKGI